MNDGWVFRERNEGGENFLEFAEAKDLAIVSILF